MTVNVTIPADAEFAAARGAALWMSRDLDNHYCDGYDGDQYWDLFDKYYPKNGRDEL